MKRVYAEKDTWRKVYCDLKEKGFSLLKIRKEIGTQIERQIYKGYGMNWKSFSKLQLLVGYEIPTIPNPFKDDKKNLKKNDELAELIGIILGDGGITDRSVVISIHSDAEDYIQRITSLVQKVLNYSPKFHKRKDKNVIDLKIHSVHIVKSLVQLGLKKGNKVKNQIKIPSWIKKNDDYFIPCIRGLIDTDGYIGKYLKHSGRYTWFQYHVGFTNHSTRLIEDFIEFCERFEIPVSRTNKFKVIVGRREGVFRILKLTKPFKLIKANFNINELVEEYE